MSEELEMKKYIVDEKFSEYFDFVLKGYNPIIRLKIYYYTLPNLKETFPFVEEYKKIFVYSSDDKTNDKVFIGKTEDDRYIIPINFSKETNFDGGKLWNLNITLHTNRVYKKEYYTIFDVDELKKKFKPLDELDCSMLRDYIIGKNMDSSEIDASIYPILFSYHCTRYIDLMAPFYRVWLEAYKYLSLITTPLQTEEGKEYLILNGYVCRDMGKITGYPGLFLLICSEKAYKKHPELLDVYPKTKEEAINIIDYENKLNKELSHELRCSLIMKYKYMSEVFDYFSKRGNILCN